MQQSKEAASHGEQPQEPFTHSLGMIVEYCPVTRKTRWKMEPGIPVNEIVATLEKIKVELLMNDLARAEMERRKQVQQSLRKSVVGLDGQPLPPRSPFGG